MGRLHVINNKSLGIYSKSIFVLNIIINQTLWLKIEMFQMLEEIAVT